MPENFTSGTQPLACNPERVLEAKILNKLNGGAGVGVLNESTGFAVNGSNGVTGTATSANTLTIKGGIITAIT